ncbi:type III-B CRISPR-associated protein Cas10/Cmr2 [Salinibacter sp.]|uniref:type III-B CRISPR-associated protein Cas10/Cmr2 n=1 Tax=Salinibacter sp. TaxID=2065818 RepID=UPI0021E8CFCE|nr:type III-B CRISPR-associated protein Cas10/Cmr2 [Salinibacter sp.]
MSIKDRFRRKLAAFLHDPIDKPLVLMQTGERHEDRARRLRDQLGLADLPAAEPASDHVASAMERAFVPKERAPVDFLDAPQLRHPFSGRLLEGASALEDVNLDGVTEAVEDAFGALADRLPGSDNPQESFLTLWRTLLPVLRAHTSNQLAPFWSVLPADTRIPDHGVFQHLTVTSAFSGMKQDESGDLFTDATLLLVTIGPAQTFIQQARKTQDLYWGSALLSHLTWAAMTPVVERHGPDSVFFPNLHGQPLVDKWLKKKHGVKLPDGGRVDAADVPTLPNRFFAVVEAADKEARADLLETIRAEVRNHLDTCKDAVLDSAVVPRDAQPPVEAVLAHLRDALSVYGVALPVQPGDGPLTPEGVVEATEAYVGGSPIEATRELLSVAESEHTRHEGSVGHVYSLLHTLTEKMLAAQKNTRAFSPLPSNDSGTERAHGERGRKCSLCGERNVLFYRGTPAQIRHNTRAVNVDDAPELNAAQMRDGEGLCGACFVKRFIGWTGLLDGPNESFPSTTEVALAPLRDTYGAALQRAEQKLSEAVGRHGGTFGDQLFFEENLRPDYLAKHVYPEREEKTDRGWLESRTEELRSAHERHMPDGIEGQMTKYYGLLVLDGDNMGSWVAGEEAPPFGDIYHSDIWDQLPDALKKNLRTLKSPSGRGKRPLTPALHAALSRALTEYALEAVRPIVEEEHHGKLVYAGGDDVLAFVPLPEALDAALHLRAAFSGHREWPGGEEAPEIDFQEEVSGFRRQGDRVVTTLGPDATASVGLALAHYKTPLGEVLRAAHGMEERAKDADEQKDKLAVAILKRSGERNDGLVPFRDPMVQEKRGPVGILQDLIQALKDPALDLSPQFIRTLQEEIRPLLTEGGEVGDSFTPEDAETLVESELARLLRRALDTDDPERADAFVGDMSSRLARVRDATGSTGYFLNMLDIVLFLHRKTHAADVRRAHSA